MAVRVQNLHARSAVPRKILMVQQSPTSLERFVRAVHRRQVLLRVIECTGLGLLGGCVAGAALAGILLWRGREAGGVSGAALACGALVGAIWGIARRPPILFAASEADRQLRTADLLSTAWVVQRSAQDQDPWRQTVLALAAARCERLSPSTVLLHRLGVRAWGGIALAVAFVGTLAALSSTSLQAGSDVRRSTDPVARQNGAAGRKPIVEFAVASKANPHREERTPEDRQPGRSDDMPSTNSDEGADPSARDNRNPKAGLASDGAGSGEGKTRRPDRPRETPDIGPVHTQVREPNTSTQTAGGAGRAANDPRRNAFGTGGTVADPSTNSLVPPWEQDSWPLALEAADHAIQAGRVPDDDRDLVREYFDRTELPAGAGHR